MRFGIHNYAEIFAALVCTYCFWRKPSFFNRWFMLFLWLTVVIELSGKLLSVYPRTKILMYNLFNGVEYIFYLSMFFFLQTHRMQKRLILAMISLFAAFFFCNLSWGQGFWTYNNNTGTVGGIFLICVCLMEYFRIYTADDPGAFTKWLSICITTGVFIFYTGTFFYNTLITPMMQLDPKAARMLHKTINVNLNVVLYSLFAIGFICETRQGVKTSLVLSR